MDPIRPELHMERRDGDVAPAGRRVHGDAEPEADRALVARMGDGDEAALGTLFDRWAPVLRSFARRMLGDPEAAVDVVEETFWQAWRQAARYAPARGDVSTWLFMICRSRALMHLRARRRLREDPLPGADVGAWESTDPMPDADADTADRAGRVRAALEALPGEQREVVRLAFFQGLSQREIADATGQPLGTIKTRTRLAFDKLRLLLPMLHDEGTR